MSLVLPSLAKPSMPLRGMLACLVGPPGCGKSSFVAQWPSPEAIIDPRDQGLVDLAYEGLISLPLSKIHTATDFDSYKNNLSVAVAGQSKTLILESITGIQALCHDAVAIADFEGKQDAKFLSYQTGPISAADRYFQQLLDLMLKAQALGKHVWLIGHTKIGTVKNVTGEDYMGTIMGCTGAMALRIQAAFTNVFVLADSPDTNKKSTHLVKGSSNFVRWMYPHTNPLFPSKNRMGLVCEFEFPSDPKEAYLEFCKRTNRSPSTGYRKS